MTGNINKKEKKYSKNLERDFSFYVKNKERFIFFGNYPPNVVHDASGVDAKRAFFIHDSTGKIVPTSEPDLLQELLVCKKSINFHIKMWAEGFAEWTLLENDIEEIEQTCLAPPWVRKGIEKQGIKIRIKNDAIDRNKNKKGSKK